MGPGKKRLGIRIRAHLPIGSIFLFAAAISPHLFAQSPFTQSYTAQSLAKPLQDVTTRNLVARPPYEPITNHERLRWFVKSSLGAQSLVAGIFSAGIGIGLNRPREYGPSWNGFGSRYGVRLTGVVTGNAMEAGLGALWGEDPRYIRAAGEPFVARMGNIVKMTFVAPRLDGHLAPAYARFAATAGNNFLSDSWRVQSESTLGAATARTALGFLLRMGTNAFAEFWPDFHGLFRNNGANP